MTPLFVPAPKAAKPYTPKSLADRWACSDRTILNMIERGELRAFRVGKMHRIPVDAVEEVECQISQSDGSEAGSVSTGEKMENVAAISLRHAPERKRRQKG